MVLQHMSRRSLTGSSQRKDYLAELNNVLRNVVLHLVEVYGLQLGLGEKTPFL